MKPRFDSGDKKTEYFKSIMILWITQSCFNPLTKGYKLNKAYNISISMFHFELEGGGTSTNLKQNSIYMYEYEECRSLQLATLFNMLIVL